MTALLVAVWLLLDYPWGLLTFVAIAALYAGYLTSHLAELNGPQGWDEY